MSDDGVPDVEPVFERGMCTVGTRETVLVVGDLHLGLEDELKDKGFTVPSQTDTLADRIVEAAADTDADRIVLIGDVKHSIPYTSFNEERELARFFDTLLGPVDRVDVAKGNHDAGLEEVLPDRVHLRPARGFTLEDAGFFHGHTWPAPEVAGRELLVLGHVHPAVTFVDDLGGRHKEPCWLRAEVTDAFRDRYDGAAPRVVVLPAANPMLGGIAVNEETAPGPLFRNPMLDLENARVTTLDGIDLGALGALVSEEE